MITENNEFVLDAYEGKFLKTETSQLTIQSYKSTMQELLEKKQKGELKRSEVEDALIDLENQKEEIYVKLQDRQYSDQKDSLYKEIEVILGKYTAYYFLLQSIEAMEGNTALPKYIEDNYTKISDKWSVKILHKGELVDTGGKFRVWNEDEPLIQLIETRTRRVVQNIPWKEFRSGKATKNFSKNSISRKDYETIMKFLSSRV